MALASNLRQYQVNPVGVWHGRCNATACSRETDTITHSGSGTFHESLFCRYHLCPFKTPDGAPCPRSRGQSSAFCDEHIRCAAAEGGEGCRQDVREGKPNIYRYCSQFHNCIEEGCRNQRDGRDHLRCDDHRCQLRGCPRPKGGSGYCADHSCERRGCMAFVRGSVGPDGDLGRYCSRHRTCQHRGCERPCHVRGNGVMEPFCGAHYCEADTCDQLRAKGRYCPAHTCASARCAEGLAWGSNHCRQHTCKDEGCPEKRELGSFCKRHECLEEDCEARASRKGRCRAHAEADRAFYDMADALAVPRRGIPVTCEQDAPLACRYQDLDVHCTRPPRLDTPYCTQHSCAERHCAQAQLYFSPYCEAHKCAVVECSSAPPGRGRFCERHACRQDGEGGCDDQAREGSAACLRHRRCRWAGCARAVGDEGVECLCARHREANRRGGRAGTPPAAWSMPGQYPRGGSPGRYPGRYGCA